MRNVCFIHSCTLQQYGTSSLDLLLLEIKKSGLYDDLDLIVINNIGMEIDVEKYNNDKITCINFSSNAGLWEIPTLLLLHYFSQYYSNKINVLYLHTKGISYTKDTPIYNNVQSWIKYMLYFNVSMYKKCLNLLIDHDTVGCDWFNCSTSPTHYSGNFWWATSTINSLESCEYSSYNSPEFWLTEKNKGIIVYGNRI